MGKDCGADLLKPGLDFLGVNFPVLHLQPPTLTPLAVEPSSHGKSRSGRAKNYTFVHFSKPTKSDAGLQGWKRGRRMAAGVEGSLPSSTP